MNLSRQKHTEASMRAAERREREDSAERLIARVPGLQTLELRIEERRPDAEQVNSGYLRRIVVERAPALFDLPCTDQNCSDGGHDITFTVLQALHQHKDRFEGEHVCNGHVGPTTCGRVLKFVATATWA